MMKQKRMLIFIGIVSCLVLNISSPAMAAEPVLGEVTLSPEHPTKLTTVTFTVNVIGEDISLAKVVVKECDKTSCQRTLDNVTMQSLGGTRYRANVTLDYPTATYITYWVYIERTAGPTAVLPDSHGVIVNLTASPSDGNQSGNNSNNGKKQPGFEVALFIAAVGGALILAGRRRYR